MSDLMLKRNAPGAVHLAYSSFLCSVLSSSVITQAIIKPAIVTMLPFPTLGTQVSMDEVLVLCLKVCHATSYLHCYVDQLGQIQASASSLLGSLEDV